MGFLDAFDSPDIMSQLLGMNLGGLSSAPPINPGQSATMPVTPAQPQANWPQQDQPSTFDPSSGLGSQAGPASTPGAPATPPAAWPPPPGLAPPGAPGSGGPAGAAPGPAIPTPAPNGATNVPLPMPRPPGADAGAALPPTSSPTMGISSPVAPPPASAMMNPPQTQGTGSLAAALGLNATPQAPQASPSQPNGWQSALAGLGKGMSAVGSMPRGANAGQAFAAGFGGGITGAVDSTDKQQAQIRLAKNDLFTQSSGAFKDMLAAKSADDTDAYRKAQSNYLNARAAQAKLGGATGGGSSAWQNTPYGKVVQVENEAQKYEKGQQILLQKRWTLNGTPPDQQQKDLDNLQKTVDSYRGRLYKQAGVDPDKADKIKNMGMSADNPFDTKGMTLDQFNEQVPMGGWFRDQNGTARQRTVPPPGSNASPTGGASPGGGQAAPGNQTMNDDTLAMQPAA